MITIPNFATAGKDPRLLVVNVGNTNTRFGWFRGSQLTWTEAMPTSEILAGAPVLPEGPCAIVSVVPEATSVLRSAWTERSPLILNAESSGLSISYHPPEAMGADRLANAIALKERGLTPGIAVDCGTATTLTVIDAQGTVVGGAIAPGLGTSARALIGNTAQLRSVSYQLREEPWGQSTQANLQIGIVEGHVGMIAHLVERIRWGLGAEAPVILCGGWASTLSGGLSFECAPYLTLEGARIFGTKGLG